MPGGGNWKTIQDEPHFQLRPAWAREMSERDMLAELRARSYERDPFDDSWAAYCLFGDPLAALQAV